MMRPNVLSAVLIVVTLAPFGLAGTRQVAAAEPRVDFNREIRPILSDKCFQCHGPDADQRQGELRLDLQADVFAERDGEPVVVPGQPRASLLAKRIKSSNPEERMPPPTSGHRLTNREIELLERWIAEGADWHQHWAFIPPTRPDLPSVGDASWPRNGIDYFSLAKMDEAELTPTTEASKTALLRRVTFDLTGLPPTLEELDAFLADDSPVAYERVVDRLLASVRYGERMAERWLDVARYADTNGYQTDGERSMWRWRDWVIEAFNDNRPFDQFTIEQLAGDLLPEPTLEQVIATGFNRNHRGNAEGGIIPEEYAVEYVVDRVDTTATVWLGLTIGCARCHDHKFDPIEQREFYRMFAYFNNVPERGKAVKFGNSPPFIKSPTYEQQRQLADVETRLEAAEADFHNLRSQIDAAQARKEAMLHDNAPIAFSVEQGLQAHFSFDGHLKEAHGDQRQGQFEGDSGAFAAGQLGEALQLDGQRFVSVEDVGDFGYLDRFSMSAWILRTDGQDGAILARMTDTARSDGYSLAVVNGRLQVNLVKRWLDDSLRVETETDLPKDGWHHVAVTYDGSRMADGVRVYVDGQRQLLQINLDDLNQDFRNDQPLRIGVAGGGEQVFRGRIDEVRIYGRVLSAADVAILSVAESIDRIATASQDSRTPAQRQKMRRWYLEHAASAPVKSAYDKMLALRNERATLIDSFPTTMVMQELPTPRTTHVLNRGQYDQPTEQVIPGVPGCLSSFPVGAPANRLGFAQWLVDPANPLTARVMVNRCWQAFFGRGLVNTTEDFGAQGEWPSHPFLLDWLATEFVRTDWDLKKLQRTIVCSATYRQSSRVSSDLAQLDPDNKLLARGPRFRLSAEMIRDQALFVSNSLVEQLGGPSVKPYQPSGLWEEVSGLTYPQDTGANLYRRGLYTYWKRTSAPPSMMTFDASSREACTVREGRTNTPLQALTLMNDETFVEAARLLAERILLSPVDSDSRDEERLRTAFRLATSRLPTKIETTILLKNLRRQREHYRLHPEAASRLIEVGASVADSSLDPIEVAAYTAVAGLVLNLDEVVTRQ